MQDSVSGGCVVAPFLGAQRLWLTVLTARKLRWTARAILKPPSTASCGPLCEPAASVARAAATAAGTLGPPTHVTRSRRLCSVPSILSVQGLGAE